MCMVDGMCLFFARYSRLTGAACTYVTILACAMGVKKKRLRVRTGPGKPGKSWNFVLPFSRTGKSWKMATGPGKSWKS